MNKDQLEALAALAQGKPIPSHIIDKAMRNLKDSIPLLLTDLQDACIEQRERAQREGGDADFEAFNAANALAQILPNADLSTGQRKQAELLSSCAMYMLLNKCDFAQALFVCVHWLKAGSLKGFPR